MYDLVIVGGGPAAISAGVYAARKKIKTLLVTESFGGQSLVSADIQNWIGTKSVSGYDWAKMLEDHLKAQEGIEVVEGELVVGISKKNDGSFEVKTQNGKVFDTKYVLIASGSRRRKLGIPGEKEWEGKGVQYCSICDAPLFKGKLVAVVGGGNAGLEAVIDLLPYASKIYLLEYSEQLKGDPVTQEKIKGNPKVEIVFMAQTLEVVALERVTALRYLDRKTNEKKDLPVDGVFVEIGILPNAEIVSGLVSLNPMKEIVVDHRTQETSCPGIWAAGDATDVLYKQNNISAGDAVKAVLHIYDKLMKG